MKTAVNQRLGKGESEAIALGIELNNASRYYANASRYNVNAFPYIKNATLLCKTVLR